MLFAGQAGFPSASWLWKPTWKPSEIPLRSSWDTNTIGETAKGLLTLNTCSNHPSCTGTKVADKCATLDQKPSGTAELGYISWCVPIYIYILTVQKNHLQSMYTWRPLMSRLFLHVNFRIMHLSCNSCFMRWSWANLTGVPFQNSDRKLHVGKMAVDRTPRECRSTTGHCSFALPFVGHAHTRQRDLTPLGRNPHMFPEGSLTRKFSWHITPHGFPNDTFATIDEHICI